ncbi:MAG: hypothetical protein KDD43_00480 [Bdellovibrionales bacterium]|nr:hypothetical protein [Bdellovibrionales bacterium]
MVDNTKSNSKPQTNQPTFFSKPETISQILSLFPEEYAVPIKKILDRVTDTDLENLAPCFISETKKRRDAGSFWLTPAKIVDFVTYSFLGGFQGKPTPWAKEWRVKYDYQQIQEKAEAEAERRREERERENHLRARGGVTSMASIVSTEKMDEMFKQMIEANRL